MKTAESLRYRRRLDNLFSKVSLLSEDPELQAHWTRYLCVLTSGFIEVSIRAICNDYVKTKSHQNIANFVESQLRWFRNPNADTIFNLVSAFSPIWADDFQKTLQVEQRVAIDSIVANRNRIAHGEDVGVTYGTLKRYYDSALLVIEMIEDKYYS